MRNIPRHMSCWGLTGSNTLNPTGLPSGNSPGIYIQGPGAQVTGLLIFTVGGRSLNSSARYFSGFIIFRSFHNNLKLYVIFVTSPGQT